MTRANNTTREGLTVLVHLAQPQPSCAATATERASSPPAKQHRAPPLSVLKHATPRLIDAQPLRSTYRLSFSHAEQPPCLAKLTQDIRIPSHPHYTHTLQPRIEDLGQADPLHSVSTLEVGSPAREQRRSGRRGGRRGVVVRVTAGGSLMARVVSQQRRAACESRSPCATAPKIPSAVSGSRLRWGVRYGALGRSSGAGLLRSHVGGSVEEQGSVGMSREE